MSRLLPTSRFSFAVICLLGLLFCGGLASAGPAHATGDTQAAATAATEHATEGAHDATAGEHADGSHHGLTQGAPIVFELGWFKVSNSMIATWLAAIALIGISQAATRKPKLIPSGLQNFWEAVVEGLYKFMEDILGKDLNRRTFWFFATIFLFILASNWLGLIPGVGSVGWGTPVEPGSHVLTHVSRPLLRGANADLNMTLAMAMIFMVFWLYWSISAQGPVGFVKHIFWPAQEKMNIALTLLLVGPFIFGGLLEIVSIAFRPVSLSFRLYGNIFAGENMLETMTSMSTFWGWLIAIPIYFLELLVGIIQALVFALLTAVFTVLTCKHDDDTHAEGGASSH